jgi:hypothetical protein
MRRIICEKDGCGQTYNPYRTEPEEVGLGEEITNEFVRRCRKSKLCDDCLDQLIIEESKKNKATHY